MRKEWLQQTTGNYFLYRYRPFGLLQRNESAEFATRVKKELLGFGFLLLSFCGVDLGGLCVNSVDLRRRGEPCVDIVSLRSRDHERRNEPSCQ